MNTNKELTVIEAQELMESNDNLQLLDVRSTEEFAKKSLPGYTNLPLADLSHAMPQLEGKKRTLLLCSDGTQSLQAQQLLDACGFETQIIRGGLRDWVEIFEAV